MPALRAGEPARNQIAPDIRDVYYKLRGKKQTAAEADAQDRGFVWVKGEDGSGYDSPR